MQTIEVTDDTPGRVRWMNGTAVRWFRVIVPGAGYREVKRSSGQFAFIQCREQIVYERFVIPDHGVEREPQPHDHQCP
jgi:hypothetical protein